MTKFYQGKFTPSYPSKYRGDVKNIVFRSGWERDFMKYLDRNSHIISWSSEEDIIPYLSPKDQKYHRYFMDFRVVTKGKNGLEETTLVEVKPLSQTVPPTKRGKKHNYWVRELSQYLVNQAKWSAAENYCLEKGWKFLIATDFKIAKTQKHLLSESKYKIWNIFK